MLTPKQIERREEIRNISRLLMVLGGCMLAFAAMALVYSGIDVRSGRHFMFSLLLASSIIGVVLIAWGYKKRHEVAAIRDLGNVTSERETRAA
jgi:Na+/melibiose symporter-like transporter